MKKFGKQRILFQKKRSPEAEKEIEELEKNIELLGVKAPQFMLERYATLKKESSAPNKVNRTKIIYNGIEYDSRREAKLAQRLDEAGIKYETQVQVEIMEGFRLNGEAVRPINIVVDFLVCGDWFLDVKGIELQPFPIKWKLLKNKFRDSKKYIILNKDSEIDNFIILAKKTGWTDS